ncbi:MAG: twin-arginine translocase TatA/TatE family subunit [Propionicimonas sp.]
MLGPWEWAMIALIALLLFGGSRLSGLGKSAGKAIREFKEETESGAKGVTATSSPATPAAAEPDVTVSDTDTVAGADADSEPKP